MHRLVVDGKTIRTTKMGGFLLVKSVRIDHITLFEFLRPESSYKVIWDSKSYGMQGRLGNVVRKSETEKDKQVLDVS